MVEWRVDEIKELVACDVFYADARTILFYNITSHYITLHHIADIRGRCTDLGCCRGIHQHPERGGMSYNSSGSDSSSTEEQRHICVVVVRGS